MQMTYPRKRTKTPPRGTKAPSKPDIGAPTPLRKPNAEDPLSETERHRRIWAAYLHRGLTRREFAEQLGTNYHTVNRWDAGAAVISLDMLERAAAILKFTMDELCFGRAAAPGAAPNAALQRVLSESEIRELLDRNRVDVRTRAAFGEHAASPGARFQSFTADYVSAWCAAYAFAQDQNLAIQAAEGARAVGEVVAAGVGPVSPDRLRGSFRSKQ